jgi:hypothetical protein
MLKVTERNVFGNPKYMNILRAISSYKEGLELKYLAYLLIGKEKLKGYISKDTTDKIPKYLAQHKIKDYQLIKLEEKNTIKNPERLSECISKLKELGLIEKMGKKYKINTYAKHLYWITADNAILEDRIDALRLGKYREGHSPTAYMDSRIHIFSKDPGINAMLKDKYGEKFGKIVKDLKEALSELDRLRNEMLSNELRGYPAREFAELAKHYDWFVDDMHKRNSNISVFMNTFEDIAGFYSPVSQRLIE